MIEILAGGGSALVEWRLETGRTHQVLINIIPLNRLTFIVQILVVLVVFSLTF